MIISIVLAIKVYYTLSSAQLEIFHGRELIRKKGLTNNFLKN